MTRAMAESDESGSGSAGGVGVVRVADSAAAGCGVSIARGTKRVAAAMRSTRCCPS